MKRSSQAQRLVLLGATTLLSLTAASAADVGPSTKPNVVFIIADDVGRTLGCYGDPIKATPYIDTLAQSGVKFTRAYGQGAVCTPSRNSFLSGLSTDKTGIHNNYKQQQEKWSNIRQMQSVFKDHGYYTVGIGKVGHKLEHEEPDSWDRREEFNQYGPGEITTERDASTPKNEKDNLESIFQRTRRNEFVDNAQTRDESRAAYFINFLKNHNPITDKPFFAVIGFHGGHDPQQYHTIDYTDIKNQTFTTTDAAWLQLKKKESLPLFNPLGFNFLPWKPKSTVEPTVSVADENMKRYYAAVHHMDKQVGQVVKALQDKELESNTFVVFIGDNGYNLGFQGQWAKHNLYADVIHLPLIVKGPGITANLPPASDRTDDGVVEYLDIFPTLVELTGLLSTTNNGTINKGITDWSSPQPGRSNGGTDLTIIQPAVSATLTTPAKLAAQKTLKLDGRSFAARLKNPSNTTGKDAAYVHWPIPAKKARGIVDNWPKNIANQEKSILTVDIPENGGEGHAIYTRDYCYVEYYGTPVKEFFNLTADPHCYENLFETLSAAQQVEANTLAGKLHAYFPVPVNTAPVVTPISSITMAAGTTFTLTLTGTDKGGAIKTFTAPRLTLVGDISSVPLDPKDEKNLQRIYTQTAHYTPASGFTGIFTTDVTAIDNLGESSVPKKVTITVTGTPPKVNAAPVAPAVPNQTAMVGEVFSMFVQAFTDANGDPLTYAASGLPPGLGFNSATRVISGQPTTPGSATITVTATDPSQASATVTFHVTVLASGVVYGLGNSVVDGVKSPWVLTKRISLESNTPDPVSATSDAFKHTGTTSLKALLGPDDECGLACSNNKSHGFSTSTFASVSFWIHGGHNGGQNVTMRVNRLAPAGLQGPVSVTSEPLPSNTWQRVIIPLSLLGAENVTDFRAFRFYNNQTAGGSPQAFFIDDVELLNAAQTQSLMPKSGG
jgi:arylsulfatase A-like enzyme